ncbi:alpha-glucan water dikinase 2 isoform X3 [Rhododendron vialii]|uniref:alpha-glucan water dikinase 2 isoform X3 n=1 Tax=Rhododendron vialii TaxID=182163 RepID=UPI00265FC095|nr:alpha-glucan water dikinase 2 isoform X3 [Rhododendron vialii]
MASSNSSNCVQKTNVHHFELGDGMRLQVNVTGFSNGSNAKVDLQLKNCSRTWILHWGCIYHGNKNWFIPADHPPGTIYKQMALQTPFTKSGDMYVIIIQLRDPRTDAIEFVLKDSRNDTWLKLNKGNFQIKIPKTDSSTSQPPIPKDLIDRRAYLRWESKGRPVSSPQQQKQDHDVALRELQSLSVKGISLDELQNSRQIAGTNRPALSREHLSSQKPYSCRRRHDIEQWTNKYTKGHMKNTNLPSSALLDRVEKSIGGDDVILQQTYNVGSYEMVVLLKIVGGDYHIIVAGNTKGATVLHWGVSKSSLGEWLAPPMDIMPENSKLLDAACQTYFMDISNGKGFFQQRRFLGIQFIIWSGGSWIKNNGANFCVGLNSITSGKVEGGGGGIVKWLLDEISHREKEAERSLMHRFNSATELTERCKNEGELGLIGMLVWLRLMACRQLTWNKNYNVKPREISEAQERFTNLLQRIYLDQPNVREILRLIMLCIGRGGQGDVGQRIRDEILVLQRNNDCKGGMMEEWHQKLHNNSSPDDVIICEALLNYVRSGFKIDVYWQTLNANGLTKDILASYDRPIVSEPHFRTDAKEGFLRDLTSYLKTLKAVHSGADLESAIETCLGFFPKDSLYFVKAHIGDKNIAPLIEKLVESRIELRPVLLTAHGRSKDLLFLDLALDSAVRTTVEMGLKDLNSASLPEIMFFIALVLENLCLSTFNNEELIYCTKDWYRVSESCKPNDSQWALQTKAVLDRVGLVLANRSQYYHQMIQPSVQYLGRLLSLDKGAIDIFTEELIRAGSAASLSMLINHLDPILRKVANLGSWQVISPMDVTGLVVSVNELISVQTKVYRKPTVIIANKVSGEEEIPNGAVAVLTADTPDVLSHVSIRARNNKVLFASCFDQNVFRDLKLKEGKAISIQLRLSNLVISEVSSFGLSQNSFSTSSIPQGLTLKKKAFRGKFAISIEEFTTEMVGAKSYNILHLRRRVPSWIKVPISAAIPFGVFETVISDDLNKNLASKISSFSKLVDDGDLSKLKAIQETVLQMKAPLRLTNELKNKMKTSRIPWPGDEGEERWSQAWLAIKKVWASKWNERAFVSSRKANLNHNNVCMAVLIQEIICADYAFVIHTKNPLSGDASEIYAEIVKGLGETLVGAYPGRAMCFTARKNNIKSPIVVGYPSKQVGLYIKKSIIFRSDSNGEDLEGYAGAGLYDSVTMDKAQETVLDYSNERMIIDKDFQISLFRKIAEAGKIIEDLYGCAQDIEGVVKEGEIHVVQTRPQI